LAQPGTPRQVRGRQRLADTVLTGIGDVSEGLEQTKGLKHTRVDADADPRVTLFDALQGRARRKGTLRYHGHWQAAPPAGIPNIGAQLAQHPADPGGRKVWRRHGDVFVRLYNAFV
jgi:hypothetical protein